MGNPMTLASADQQPPMPNTMTLANSMPAQPMPIAQATTPAPVMASTQATPSAGNEMPKLDVSRYAVSKDDPSADPSKWAKREDGTKKGQGFLGLLKNAAGGVSSEISIGVDFGKGEVTIPTIVPTLNQQELDYLLANPKGKTQDLPPSILKKAVDHARMRMSQGLSPFAD